MYLIWQAAVYDKKHALVYVAEIAEAGYGL